jgi:octaprenyl-diphosphate synthase
MHVKEIFSDYAEELRVVDRDLLEIFSSNVFLIPTIGRHILGSGGKRMRPLFLLQSADLCGYKGKDRTVLAAVIEAIHTASLLHDDVIDGADTRRGRPASHAIWGNQVVILVGDFLYSKALKIAVDQKNQAIMETLSDATTRMTEGEVLQLHKTGDPEITTDEYFQIIAAKTGVLISAACKIGAILAGQGDGSGEALARFGLKTGLAFQLADDILDYTANEYALGKRLGKDLEEGKITMPLIQLLGVAPPAEQDEVKALIERASSADEPVDRSKNNGKDILGRITDLLVKHHAIEESLSVAQGLVGEAKEALRDFPPSPAKESILLMADYALQRDK